MAICSACGNQIKKGNACYQCFQCYNIYCVSDGQTYADENGEYVCVNCNHPLTYTYCNF